MIEYSLNINYGPLQQYIAEFVQTHANHDHHDQSSKDFKKVLIEAYNILEYSSYRLSNDIDDTALFEAINNYPHQESLLSIVKMLDDNTDEIF